MIDLQCHVIIKKAGKQHKNHIYRIAPGIKDQAADKKQNIPELLRYKVIEKQERGQKTKNKENAAEYHND